MESILLLAGVGPAEGFFEALHRVEGLLLDFSDTNTPPKLLVRYRDREETWHSNTNGLFVVPLRANLILEDPLVVLPPCKVEQRGFERSDGIQLGKPAGEQSAKADGEADERSALRVSNWMTYYYRSPEPDKSAFYLAEADRGGICRDVLFSAPMSAFLGIVLRDNTAVVPDIVRAAKNMSVAARQSLWTAVWMANSTQVWDRIILCAKDISVSDAIHLTVLRQITPPDLLSSQVESPTEIDMLWASFFASGSRQYVERIIDLLPQVHEENDPATLLIGGAARWSLRSNAEQHERVLDVCRERVKRADGNVRTILQEIIAVAEKKRAKRDDSGEIIDRLKLMTSSGTPAPANGASPR